MSDDAEAAQAAQDAEFNREDLSKLDYTDKSTSEEDGEQPQSIPPWNDDEGEIEIL